MTTQLFHESVELLLSEANRETRTVPQVIIKAGMSKNKRHYPKTVLQEAVFLFEGASTFANHPTQADLKNRAGRNLLEKTGWLDNVHFDESRQAIIGTRHFTNNQAGRDVWDMVEQVINGQAPASLIGASINALGKGSKAPNGDFVEVEAITQVVSVDDVDSPAAGGGFERLVASDDSLISSIFSEMDYLEWFEARPEFTERLQKELKAVRQDEAVKAAKAEADALRETVLHMEAQIQEQTTLLEATRAELERARREVRVIDILQQSTIPAQWRKDLRHQLLESNPDQWDAIMERELSKSKHAAPKAPVKGTAVQVAPALVVPLTPVDQTKPRDNEDFEQWRRRLNS